ncbi:hypothetical protein AB3X94_08010 [Paraburkholderia sp. BR10923]|uniref:hypothetical protein n=1 Tax=Paraburkholderia sp. BR10923 TaxID=3236992 RepID=UPI0034CFB624
MDEQAELNPPRRGPGRPRKVRPAEAAPVASPVVAPVDPLAPLVTDRRGAGKILGVSVSTIKRLEKSDPDFPRAFAVGAHRDKRLIEDIRGYALKKARVAAESGAA